MTGLSMRITTETRKHLETTFGQAFRAGALPLVKRVSALLGLTRGEPVDAVAAGVGVSRRSTAYAWLRTFRRPKPRPRRCPPPPDLERFLTIYSTGRRWRERIRDPRL